MAIAKESQFSRHRAFPCPVDSGSATPIASLEPSQRRPCAMVLLIDCAPCSLPAENCRTMLSCIALAQRRSRRAYIKALGWDVQSSGRADRSARAEIRPGEAAWLLSQSPEQQARLAEIRWGYRSAARAAAPALQ